MKTKFWKTISFKLALWYSASFMISAVVIFSILFFLINHFLNKSVDDYLMGESKEFTALYYREGLSGLKAESTREVNSVGHDNLYIRLFDENGELFFHTKATHWRHIDSDRISVKEIRNQPPLIRTVPLHNGHHRQAKEILFPVGNMYMDIVYSEEKNEDLLEQLREAYGWGMLVALQVSFIVGWLMAKRSFSQVQAITETAEKIAAGSTLKQRVPLRHTEDECDRLAATFNTMLDRIEELVEGMQQMIDNVAHDLRTPLSRIRVTAEMALMDDDIKAVKVSLAQIMEQCDRFIIMINTMLDISEAEAGLLRLKKQKFSLDDLFREIEELFLISAQKKGVELIFDVPGKVFIDADRIRLRQAIANLIDNAINYTPSKGKVIVSVEELEEDAVLIRIRDTGIGIQADELPHIFDRFYRGDRSRSKYGSGLGLPLAKALIQAHGGKIEVESKPGRGSLFKVILPKHFKHSINPVYS